MSRSETRQEVMDEIGTTTMWFGAGAAALGIAALLAGGWVPAALFVLGVTWTLIHARQLGHTFAVLSLLRGSAYEHHAIARVSAEAVAARVEKRVQALLAKELETAAELRHALASSKAVIHDMCLACPDEQLSFDGMKALGRIAIALDGDDCEGCGMYAPLVGGECPDCRN